MLPMIESREKYRDMLAEVEKRQDAMMVAIEATCAYVMNTLIDCGLTKGNYVKIIRGERTQFMQIHYVAIWHDPDSGNFNTKITGREVLGFHGKTGDPKLGRGATLFEDLEFEVIGKERIPFV